MIKSSTRFVIAIVLLFSLSFLGGKETNVRTFDSEEMKAYAEQQDFAYMDYTVRPPSIWERLGWWFERMMQTIFGNPNTPWLGRIGYYMILFVISLADF